MEEDTLILLLERQEPRCLRLKSLIVDSTGPPVLSKLYDLEELRFDYLRQHELAGWMGELVATNVETLRHLEIGAENHLFNVNYANFQLFKQEVERNLSEYSEDDDPSHSLLSLSSLTLVGLCLLDLDDRKGRPIIDWTKLRALALKSCSQLGDTLTFLQSALVNSGGPGEGVNLKSFDLRSDNGAVAPFSADALKTFLISFNGLVHLGLLLEDRSVSSSLLAGILAKHGPTLRRFIWDVRVQGRTSFAKDMSRAQSGNRSVSFIVKLCPLLEELGLSFDWPALMDPDGESGTLSKVRQLPFDT